MTEEELIEEGFERIDVPIEESGDKTDYYYYRLSFSDFTIYSTESTDSPNNKWTVTLDFFTDNIVDIEDVQTLLALFKKWKIT